MNYFLPIGLVALAALCVLSCAKNPEQNVGSEDSIATRPICDSVFVSPFGGYGYDIMISGKVAIHQPHVPVIDKQAGFPTIETARGAAQLVINKLKQNHFPPGLTQMELSKLGIAD